MTKTKLAEEVVTLWKSLNSDISKEEKLTLLTTLSGLIHRGLDIEKEKYNETLLSCNVVINEFKNKLEIDPKYKDDTSNLTHFILAIEYSSLPLQ